MCIITFQKGDSSNRIPREVLKRCLIKYPHGMGIMYAHKGKLITWKTMDDFDGIWNRYTSARDRGLPTALHFRYTTKGENTLANCHPFHIDPSFAFMHNGTITPLNPLLTKEISDSRYIAEEVLSHLPGDFLHRPAIRKTLVHLLGGDRMLFMDFEGNHEIINEDQGFWHEGTWYSHGRDREFLLTGKERTYSTSYGGFKDYVGYQSHKDRVEADSAPRNGKPDKEPNWWHRSRNAEITGNSHHLVFDYGQLDEITDDMTLITSAKVKGVALWAGKDAHGNEIPVAVLAEDESLFIQGDLYEVNGWDGLKVLEKEYGSVMGMPGHVLYERRVMKASIGTSGGVFCNIWVGKDSTEIVAPVPFGDWTRWAPVHEVLEPAGLKESGTGYRLFQCKVCSTEDTKVFSTFPDVGKETYKLWCYECEKEYSIPTTTTPSNEETLQC